jgi:hypothetical protein
MSGFNKNFKDGRGGLRGGANNASGGFQSSEAKSSSSNSNPPIAFWDMEEDGSGTTATDRSEAGNGLDLTIRDVGGGSLPTWDSGTKARGSYSLKIAGTQDQAHIADDGKLDFAADDTFSVSFFVRNIGTGSPSGWAYICKMANSAPYRGWAIENTSPGKINFFLVETWATAAIGLRTAASHMNNTTDWHHIVATYDGSADEAGVVVYFDGTAYTKAGGGLTSVVTDTLNTDDTTVNATDLTLGSRATGQHASIYLDDVAIFDYVLTADQVTSIYNSGDSLDVSDGIPT